MLGEALIDPHGIDGNAPGLGLLPLVTLFEPEKALRPVNLRWGPLHGPWAAWSGQVVQGYEIHHGQTAPHPAMAAAGDLAHEVLPGLAWQGRGGQVLGTYLHGLFENPGLVQALAGAAPPKENPRTLDEVFEGLAGLLDRHVTPGTLAGLIA
jgi:adenosylcobyric acid synthase